MKSARARREEYVGTWLPEPVVEDRGRAARRGSLGRAADGPRAAVAAGARGVPAARHLRHGLLRRRAGAASAPSPRAASSPRGRASTSRRSARGSSRPTRRPSSSPARSRPRSQPATSRRSRRVLAEDAVLYSDGGGKRRAALNPIFGRDEDRPVRDRDRREEPAADLGRARPHQRPRRVRAAHARWPGDDRVRDARGQDHADLRGPEPGQADPPQSSVMP